MTGRKGTNLALPFLDNPEEAHFKDTDLIPMTWV
jgi:hypothetical protein